MPQTLRRADWAEGLWSGPSICSTPSPLTMRSFILRPHYMNCSMLWVSLDSSSRSGGIALQALGVNERNVNEKGSLPSLQLFPSSSAPPFLRFPLLILPSSLSALSSRELFYKTASHKTR